MSLWEIVLLLSSLLRLPPPAAPAAPAGRTRPRLTKDQRSLLARGSRDNTTVATYTVFFYYTREFARDTPDIDRFIDEVLDKTNRGYQQVGQQ